MIQFYNVSCFPVNYTKKMLFYVLCIILLYIIIIKVCAKKLMAKNGWVLYRLEFS